MDAEQTWPTKEELAEAANNKNRKIVKVVPKGTSEYQAAWIPDEDGGIYLSSLSLFPPLGKYLISFHSFTLKNIHVPLFIESLGICSENESDDNMSVEEARSEAASSEELDGDEQYETITISEAPLDEERYDQDIDMFEEKQAMENFKGYYNYMYP